MLPELSLSWRNTGSAVLSPVKVAAGKRFACRRQRLRLFFGPTGALSAFAALWRNVVAFACRKRRRKGWRVAVRPFSVSVFACESGKRSPGFPRLSCRPAMGFVRRNSGRPSSAGTAERLRETDAPARRVSRRTFSSRLRPRWIRAVPVRKSLAIRGC